MAPSFRNRDRSNRSGRGQVEHNVLEGLPITQWREAEVQVGPNVADEQQPDKDSFWPELPMPRDSHLLPLHSQQLLRAARACRPYKPPVPPEEDRDHLDEEDEPKEVQQGFTVKKFVKVARHLEDAEPEYLAKRRKGLPSQYAVAKTTTHPTPLRETKVKKVDSEGNVSVYKALVPEDQTVEGEIQPTDTALVDAPPATAAPGTVVEGVGIVNAAGVVVVNEIPQPTPPRRKAPPKKKKIRGRKKKVVFAEGSTEQGTPAAGGDLLAVPGAKQENGSVEPSDGDTPMADAGDDEEEETDEEGEEKAQSPMPPRSASPSKTPTVPPTDSVPNPVPADPVPVKEPSPTPTAPVVEEPAAPEDLPPLPPLDASIPQPSESVKALNVGVDTDLPKRSNRDPSSSPDLPLAHSRQNSLNQIPTISTLEPNTTSAPEPVEPAATTAPLEPTVEPVVKETPPPPTVMEPQPEPTVTEPQPPPLAMETQSQTVVMETQPQPVVTETQPQPVVMETQPQPVLMEIQPQPVVMETEPQPAESELLPQPTVTEPSPQPAVMEPQPQPAVVPPPVLEIPAEGLQDVPSNAHPAESLPQHPIGDSNASDGETDLLGSLQAHLDQEDRSLADP